MDRQSLLAFLLIGLIIVFYPWYMSIVAPTALNEQVASIEQYQDETITPTTTAKQPSSFKKGDSPLKTVRVTNGLYDLELSNKSGGSFSKYQLFNYTDHEGRLVSLINTCLLYTSPSPRDRQKSRMPSSA